MKAALHLAIFVMTVYDYFFKKTAEAEAKPDEEAVVVATNRDSLLERKEKRMF